MRPFLLAAALFATPAAAQDVFSRDREVELRAEQDMARQRMNALQNEIHAIEGRVRTEQTLRDLESRREPLRVNPNVDASTTARPPAPGYAAIPDATLADSNARVREASGAR